MSLHTRASTRQAAVPPSHSALTGQSFHRQKKKKKSSIYVLKVASVMFNSCNPVVGCSLPGFFVRRFLQVRILERIGQYWLSCPSRAPYSLLPSPPTPLSTWCCLIPCNSSSCIISMPGHHRASPSPPGQAQE